ncbi:hypothetical protein OHB56_02425 [Streptomyces sp. NBC_01635]|uniref:Uncharacterized protein n=1 Tax=Streptomyces hirsutus TaxID=35620 RepID=A0ABZ1H0H7_9ACTN|nr:hypothetical protein [Streptomyces hirsutus]WSD11057.1 hypothetical protein OIE73_38875 [Streptomyces hirsutus]WTD72928.1 hypothetical protein OHB56_02425 [Streptomyces sp. NBC_01635]
MQQQDAADSGDRRGWRGLGKLRLRRLAQPSTAGRFGVALTEQIARVVIAFAAQILAE